MPSPENTDRVHDAVLWAKQRDNRYSEPVVAAPAQLLVRWTDVASQVLGPDGTPIAKDAECKVDRLIPLGSIMARGTLANYLGTGSVNDTDELMEVISRETTDDIKGRETEYYVGLRRYGKDLPVVE